MFPILSETEIFIWAIVNLSFVNALKSQQQPTRKMFVYKSKPHFEN